MPENTDFKTNAVEGSKASGTDALEQNDTLSHMANIVAAYVSNNHVARQDLPGLVAAVDAALKGLTSTANASHAEAQAERPTPAQIRKSITPNALISFIDGKPYKTLKRHLTKHGLDGHRYRERFGLPKDYPMTSQIYSEHRAALARNAGLGRKAKIETPTAASRTQRSAKQAVA